MSDSSQFDCRGRSYVLCFAMAKILPFSQPLRFTVSLYSVLHHHFLYHMYIRVVSVVCYNYFIFFPCLKALNSSFFRYRDFSLDIHFMGCYTGFGAVFASKGYSFKNIFQVGPTFPNFSYFFDLLLLFPTFS